MGRLIVALVALLGACADMTEVVRERAGNDLDCEEDRIYVEDAELGVYRLRGCGKEASYRCTDGRGIGEVSCVRLDRTDLVEPGAALDGEHRS
jgi:hypothetical protein